MSEKIVHRYAVPFDLVQLLESRLPLIHYTGRVWEAVGRYSAPTPVEIRETLIGFRKHLGWSRASLAAFLGVTHDVIRRWETGERTPNGAARRLIWLVSTLTLQPDKLRSALDVICWGQCQQPRESGKIPRDGSTGAG